MAEVAEVAGAAVVAVAVVVAEVDTDEVAVEEATEEDTVALERPAPTLLLSPTPDGRLTKIDRSKQQNIDNNH